MAGRRPKAEKSHLLRMKVAPRLYAYLGTLSRETVLGGDENETAKYLLTQRLEIMIKQRYHETERPPDEDEL